MTRRISAGRSQKEDLSGSAGPEMGIGRVELEVTLGERMDMVFARIREDEGAVDVLAANVAIPV